MAGWTAVDPICRQREETELPSRFRHALLLAVVCCLLPLIETAAQTGQEPAQKGDRLEGLESSLRRAGAAYKAAHDYAKSLGLEGKSAKDAMDFLAERGFKCAIKQVSFGKSRHENNRWTYWQEIKPLISCEKTPTEIENCRLLLISSSAKWQDPTKSPSELLIQAPSSSVDIVGGVCSSR
jgi:hypothetical protein